MPAGARRKRAPSGRVICSQDLAATDIATVARVCACSDVEAQRLLLTANGDVKRAIELKFELQFGL